MANKKGELVGKVKTNLEKVEQPPARINLQEKWPVTDHHEAEKLPAKSENNSEEISDEVARRMVNFWFAGGDFDGLRKKWELAKSKSEKTKDRHLSKKINLR